MIPCINQHTLQNHSVLHKFQISQVRHSSTMQPEFPEQHENLDGEGWFEGEESGWEDDGDDSSQTMYRTASPAGSVNAYARTFRKRRRPPFSVNGSRRQFSRSSSNTTTKRGCASPIFEERPLVAREDLVDGALHGALFTIKYSLDVLGRALHFLRYPLSFFIFLWFLGVLTTRMHTLQSAYAPLCIIPGISSSFICRPEPLKASTKRRSQWADYPRLVEAESKSLDSLLTGFVGGSALSLEIKQAEMATVDLVALVRISDLKAKDTLATSLGYFIDDAKRAGRGLQRLSSKVGGAVDKYVFNISLLLYPDAFQ